MAARYEEEGVATTLSRYDGAIHGFATFPVPMRERAMEEISAWLRENFR